MSNPQKYYYPRLSNRDWCLFRIGGPGLANCMFFAARAYINSVTDKGIFISPTWKKFSIGPILRKERDKRVYSDIFKNKGKSGLSKIIFLIKNKLGLVETKTFGTLYPYFTDLQPYQSQIADYFNEIVNPKTIENVKNEKLEDYVAVHVRLGDYNADQRIPLIWYSEVIKNILHYFPNQKFALFSDGSDEELKELLEIKNIERKFYGNAFADMYAISKCKVTIASDSTFSAWGAFLGKVPLIFNRRHFPPVFNDDSIEFVLGNKTELSPQILKLF